MTDHHAESVRQEAERRAAELMRDHLDHPRVVAARQRVQERRSAEKGRFPCGINRVLVCGSRTYPEADEMVGLILYGVDEMHSVGGHHPIVIEGGAKGADRAAHLWVQGFGSEYPYPHQQFPADWAKDGRAAGPIRNQRMLTEGKPDIVLAFVDKPLAESKGTADMVRRAQKAGIPTYVIQRVEEAT